MSDITTAAMPEAVRKYFDAMNNGDSAGMAALFPPDGLVNDIQREFWGPESITRWTDREIVADHVVATRFVAAKEHHGDYIVSAAMDGDYDKTGLPDPLVLTFYFSLVDNQISRLIILANRPGY